MKKQFIAMALLLAAVTTNCSKEDNGTASNTTASELSSPANNTECLTGTSISETQNKVTFQWNAADGTESYFLYVKDLTTQIQLQYSAMNATSFDVTLTKGKPYAWYVGARKSDGTTINSTVWKFYNAGTATVSHAPFPADLVAPTMSSTVSGTTVTLQWAGNDVDNDITNYSVYLDTNTNPTTLLTTTALQKLENITVAASTKYYWKIVTEDAAGNTTISPVYQFKVN